MEIFNLKDMVGQWFIGDFKPVAFRTKKAELSFKLHPKGQIWDKHYHLKATEVNLIVKGKMTIQGKTLKKNDIFVLKPKEIANPVFLTDCYIICFKTGSYKNDKYIV